MLIDNIQISRIYSKNILIFIIFDLKFDYWFSCKCVTSIIYFQYAGFQFQNTPCWFSFGFNMVYFEIEIQHIENKLC